MNSGNVRRSQTRRAINHSMFISPHTIFKAKISPANHFVIFRLILIACKGPIFLSRIRYGTIDNLNAKMIHGTISNSTPIMMMIYTSKYAQIYFMVFWKSTNTSEYSAFASLTIFNDNFLYHNPNQRPPSKTTIVTMIFIISTCPVCSEYPRVLLMICKIQ